MRVRFPPTKGTLIASALRRKDPFEPYRHSEMSQGVEGDIFENIPPGESIPLVTS